MLFKNVYVLILCIGFMFSQTYYSIDQFILNPEMEMSARGYALGKTGLMKDDNAFWVISNPSALTKLEGLNISFSGNLSRYKEHRSVRVNDSFGGYTADASYVFNDNNFNYYAACLSYGVSDVLALGLAYHPYYSYGYNYIEPVHDASYDLNRDPLVGYHKENFSGDLSSITTAISYKMYGISFGFNYNKIVSETIKRNRVVEVISESNNLASPTVYNDTLSYKFSDESFFSFGLTTNILRNLVLSFSMTESVNLEINGDSNNLGNYKIPSKTSFGFELKPRQEIPASIIFQYDNQNYSNLDISSLNDAWFIDNSEEEANYYDKETFHFGIEIDNNKTQLRFGMVYENSIFQRDLDNAIFTFGIGKNINNLIIDLAANYSSLNYSYVDSFIPENNLSNPDSFEKITETNFDMMLTISYKFKF